MPIVPLLKGKAAEAIIKDFQKSKLNSYSDDERVETNAVIEKILDELKGKINDETQTKTC